MTTDNTPGDADLNSTDAQTPAEAPVEQTPVPEAAGPEAAAEAVVPEPASEAASAASAPAVATGESPAAAAPVPAAEATPAAAAAVAPETPVAGSTPAASAPAAPAAPVQQAPAQPQHTQPTQPVGAFGQQAPNATVYAPDVQPQSYAQYGQHPTQPTQPYAAVPGAPTAPETNTEKKRGALPIVAAVVAGALVGGLSGAGVTALALGNNGKSSSSSASVTPQNVVVNNTDSVTEITAVAAKASPSVVTISVQGQQGAGTGSGVILSADGYVLTNTHVVTLDGSEADPTIQVRTADGKLYDATVVGTDPTSDLAVIKLKDASGLTPLEFADSSKLNVGDTAIAIGAPLGLSGTVTNGIVSALNRSIQVASSAAPDTEGDQQDQGNGGEGGSPFDFWNFDMPGQQQQQRSNGSSAISLSVIQTDAAINPGNSGGALLNSKGEVIGINVAIASAGESTGGQSGSIGVGFAIPANLAKRVADELIKDGKATHGLLGATVADANSTEAGIVGALINSVSSGGGADQAGLRKGDIVTVFNGIQITDANDLTAQVRFLPAGAKAELTYVRDGKTVDATVTLGDLADAS